MQNYGRHTPRTKIERRKQQAQRYIYEIPSQTAKETDDDPGRGGGCVLSPTWSSILERRPDSGRSDRPVKSDRARSLLHNSHTSEDDTLKAGQTEPLSEQKTDTDAGKLTAFACWLHGTAVEVYKKKERKKRQAAMKHRYFCPDNWENVQILKLSF